ncbi:MAG: zf-TFIIB domain-containing protein [Pyrinomonadaceae bacterium]|nr:zf-TFIIB domain-containing protein [Pyrinomonadaceae bacterium]
MQAETLNCPMCGAAASTDATSCLYCNARLATVACPSCFGMMFLDSRHCQRCGAKGKRAEAQDVDTRPCPRCRRKMKAVAIGTACLHECEPCGGLWVEAAAFEQICADREQQSAVLGAPLAKLPGANNSAAAGSVRYVPCPECGQLMNRVNFARCSGVVVDTCKAHGTWFDRDELQRIVEFIRAGGLSASRAREIEQLAEERRRLQQEQAAAAMRSSSLIGFRDDKSNQSSLGIGARELFKLLLD